MWNPNETTEEVHAKQKEISNESPMVPTLEEALSLRVPEAEVMPPEKSINIKRQPN